MRISTDLKLKILTSWYNKDFIYLENLSDTLFEECRRWSDDVVNYRFPYDIKVDVAPFYGIWPHYIEYKRKRVSLMYDIMGEKHWSDWFCIMEGD